MSGFFDIYSIIFLIIAVVIFMRLGSVLGRRTGNEPSPYDNPVKAPQAGTRPDGARNDNVVALPPRGATPPTDASELEPLARHAAPGTPAHDGLVAIARATPGFDAGHFISGAKAAYEMIVTAYAQGDRTTLKNLLAPDVYDGFTAAIDEREKKGEKAELTFVGIDEAKISSAELAGTIARISVRFVAELITATRDKDNAVIDGDATEVQTIRDSWTFSRDTGSRDPNWKLVATEAV